MLCYGFNGSINYYKINKRFTKSLNNQQLLFEMTIKIQYNN